MKEVEKLIQRSKILHGDIRVLEISNKPHLNLHMVCGNRIDEVMST